MVRTDAYYDMQCNTCTHRAAYRHGPVAAPFRECRPSLSSWPSRWRVVLGRTGPYVYRAQSIAGVA